jgi:hypothetical protein
MSTVAEARDIDVATRVKSERVTVICAASRSSVGIFPKKTPVRRILYGIRIGIPRGSFDPTSNENVASCICLNIVAMIAPMSGAIKPVNPRFGDASVWRMK